MKGINIFTNVRRAIVFTYLGCFFGGILDYILMKGLNLSPFLLPGLAGLTIVILDIMILLKFRYFKIDIYYKYFLTFPTILALTWGWASFSFYGAQVTDTFFWYSFVASVLAYLQPVINSLLYGPVIIELFRQSVIDKYTKQQMKNKGGNSILVALSELDATDRTSHFKSDVRDALSTVY